MKSKSAFKLIDSKLFSKPNNIMLQTSVNVNYLCKSNQPSVDFLNTCRQLSTTIQVLSNLRKNADANYLKDIESNLQFLQNAKQNYAQFIRLYIDEGGKVTAHGLASLLERGNEFQLEQQWIRQKLHPLVPKLFKRMNRLDLQVSIQALQRAQSHYTRLLQQQLGSRSLDPPVFAKVHPTQPHIFEYCQNSGSNNLLINALQSNQNYYFYKLHQKINNLRFSSYALH